MRRQHQTGPKGIKVKVLLLCLSVAAVFCASPASPSHLSNPVATTWQAAAPGDQAITRAAERFLASAQLASSLVGLEIMELNSGKILYSHNAARRFTPASSAKIIIASCAFDLLGADFRYTTSLLASGRLVGGELLGNLILDASQDPELTWSALIALFHEARRSGLTRVGGTIHVQEPPGAYDYFCPAWMAEDWAQHWMPASSSLVVDRNLIAPGSRLPDLPVESLHTQVRMSSLQSSLIEAKRVAGWLTWDRESGKIYQVRSPFLKGSYLPTYFLTNPTEFHLAAARAYARSAGIEIADGKIEPHGPLTTLAVHTSGPFTQILQTTLRRSDNLYAQQLLRTLGANRSEANNESSPEAAGLKVVTAWLRRNGIPGNHTLLFDACGLSRKNLVSPHALNLVLKEMSSRENGSVFLDLLSTRHGHHGARFRYKTGAMDSICAITGIITTAQGKQLALTVLVNGHERSVRSLRSQIRKLADELMGAAGPQLSFCGTPYPDIMIACQALENAGQSMGLFRDQKPYVFIAVAT